MGRTPFPISPAGVDACPLGQGAGSETAVGVSTADIGAAAFCPNFSLPMRLTLVGLLVSSVLAPSFVHGQPATEPTLDRSFHPPKQAFEHVLPLPDGRCLVAGDFKFLDGAPLNHLARLQADGSLDLSFDSGEATDGVTIRGLVLQADRRVIVYGEFKEYRGVTRHRIVRLLSSGALDESFVPPSGSGSYTHFPISTAALAPGDQGIYVGSSYAAGVYGGAGLARLLPDGSVDATFSPDEMANRWGTVEAIAVDAEGRVLAAGNFPTGYEMRRFLPSGTLDRTFKRVAIDQGVARIVCGPDGRILVGGSFKQVNGTARAAVVRLHPDGAVDGGFRPAPELSPTGNTPVVSDLELKSDGGLVIAGEFRNPGLSLPLLMQLQPNGALDPVLTNAFDGRQIAWRRVPAIALDGQGHLLASGVFRLTEAPERENCARFTLGSESVGLMLRAGPDQIQLSSQVHPGRRLTLETARDAAGPWNSLATTNPVMSGVWSVGIAQDGSAAGFFRVH